MSKLAKRVSGYRLEGKSSRKASQLLATCMLSSAIVLSPLFSFAQELKPATLPASLNQSDSRLVDADYLRVGLSDQSMQNQEYPLAVVSATGSYQVVDGSTGKVLFSYASDAQSLAIPSVTVTSDSFGFTVTSAKGIASKLKGPILVQPMSANSRVNLPNILRYKRVPNYRGYFEITRATSSPKKLSVVNILPLQDYLKAVVPNELPAKYGTEAIRAQAIAARNYALRPRDKVWPQFDICDSQYCQAYYGAQTETPSTSKALEETEGLVALYDGEVALALYSSASGGYRESYSNAFSDPVTKQYPAPPIPYLSAGPDIPLNKTLFPAAKDLSSDAAAKQFWSRPDIESYDVNSPHYRWERFFTRIQLEQLLNQNLRRISKDKLTADFVSPHLAPTASIGTLKSIKVTRRGQSGKAMVLEIQGSNGTWTIQKEFVIRKALMQNSRMLLSGNIIVTPATDAKGALATIKIQGGGLGHGVGMSQLGASWMHFHGFNFVDIIQHYYTGVSLGSIPLAVGEASSATFSKTVQLGGPVTGVQHSFYVKQADNAVLVVRTPLDQKQVYLGVNGQAYRFEPGQAATISSAGNVRANEYRIPISNLLKENTVNSLALFPDSTAPTRPIKAWVELYKSKVTAQRHSANIKVSVK